MTGIFELKSTGMDALASASAGLKDKPPQPHVNILQRPPRGLTPSLKADGIMSIKETLQADVIAHMKAGRRLELTTVRNMLGEIGTREKSGKTPVELDDAQVTSLLQKEAAKRRDTAGIYTDAGESARAAAEIAEAVIIEAYLPAALTRSDVEAIVSDVVAGLKADGIELSMRSMGLVMKPVTANVAGRFDGKTVSEIVRTALA